MPDEVTAPDVTPAPGEPTDDATGTLDTAPNSGKTFTQAEVDNILRDRLNRQKAAVEGAAQKAKDEAERLAAEKQGEFKALYETEKVARIAAEIAKEESDLAVLRSKVGGKNNLPIELHDRLKGKTEEELDADAKTLLAAIPRPSAITTNDATEGVNTTVPTAQKSDAEIREEAARFGVSFEALKAQYQK